MGAKKRPFYRVVVADARSPRDGRVIETIGHYNPLTDPATIVIDAQRARYWLSVGAQPTVSVSKLMRRTGIDGRASVAATDGPDSPTPAEPTAVAQQAAQGPSDAVQAPPTTAVQDTASVALEPAAVAQQEAQAPTAADDTAGETPQA
jgi:small subunit ribosomal protein S16